MPTPTAQSPAKKLLLLLVLLVVLLLTMTVMRMMMTTSLVSCDSLTTQSGHNRLRARGMTKPHQADAQGLNPTRPDTHEPCYMQGSLTLL